jgi:hypothetical protein
VREHYYCLSKEQQQEIDSNEQIAHLVNNIIQNVDGMQEKKQVNHFRNVVAVNLKKKKSAPTRTTTKPTTSRAARSRNGAAHIHCKHSNHNSTTEKS